MAAITVLKFSTQGGAEKALEEIKNLAKEHLIILQDAAIVTWPIGKNKPQTQQIIDIAGADTLDGAFWGMLFGLIFIVPLLQAAGGSAMGTLSGSFTELGIDGEFVKSVRDKVKEGTSALFLLTGDAVLDKVAGALQEFDFELIASNLSREQDAQLRAVFISE